MKRFELRGFEVKSPRMFGDFLAAEKAARAYARKHKESAAIIMHPEECRVATVQFDHLNRLWTDLETIGTTLV